ASLVASKPASFKFTGCCWWRSLAVDGGSGTSRGHALTTLVLRSPGARRPRIVAWHGHDRLIRIGRRTDPERQLTTCFQATYPPVLSTLTWPRSSRIVAGRGALVKSSLWRRNFIACSPSPATCS